MTNDSARNYCSNFPLTTLTVSNSGTLRAEKKKPVEPHFQTWKLIAACHVMKEHGPGQKKNLVFFYHRNRRSPLLLCWFFCPGSSILRCYPLLRISITIAIGGTWDESQKKRRNYTTSAYLKFKPGAATQGPSQPATDKCLCARKSNDWIMIIYLWIKTMSKQSASHIPESLDRLGIRRKKKLNGIDFFFSQPYSLTCFRSLDFFFDSG